jgi:hypothetical protein
MFSVLTNNRSMQQEQSQESFIDQPPPYHVATAPSVPSARAYPDASMAIGQPAASFHQFGGLDEGGSQFARAGELYAQSYAAQRAEYGSTQDASHLFQNYPNGVSDISWQATVGFEQPTYPVPPAPDTVVQHDFNVTPVYRDNYTGSLYGSYVSGYHQSFERGPSNGVGVTAQVRERRLQMKERPAASMRGLLEAVVVYHFKNLADTFEIALLSELLEARLKPWIMTDRGSGPIGLAFPLPIHITCMMLTQWDLVWYRLHSNPDRHNHNIGATLFGSPILVFATHRTRALRAKISSFSHLLSAFSIELDSPSSDNGLYQCSPQQALQSWSTRVHFSLLLSFYTFQSLNLLICPIIVCLCTPKPLSGRIPVILPMLQYVSICCLLNHLPDSFLLGRAFGSTISYSYRYLKGKCDWYLYKRCFMPTPPRCSFFFYRKILKCMRCKYDEVFTFFSTEILVTLHTTCTFMTRLRISSTYAKTNNTRGLK